MSKNMIIRNTRIVIICFVLAAAAISLCFAAKADAADIGTPGKDSLLTRMVTDDNGNIYVMGSAKSKMGESDPESTLSRIWVKKYSADDIDTPAAEWIFDGTSSAVYSVGDTSHNGALALDKEGNIYVGAVKSSGSARDMMVFKLDSDLNLLGSKAFATVTNTESGTYKDPKIRDLAVSDDGSVFVAGDTYLEIPQLTEPAYALNTFSHGGSFSSQQNVGFIVKLDSSLALEKGTYMGGSENAVNRVICDGEDIYLLGRDNTGQVPTTEGTLQPEKTTPTSQDAFLLKMTAAGLEPVCGTYYGGRGSEDVADMKLVGNNLFVFGDSTSTDLLISENAALKENNGAESYRPTAFVMRISKSLKNTDYFAATFFGNDGSSLQRIDAFAMDVRGGNVYITGSTGGATAIDTIDGTSSGRIFMAALKTDMSAVLSSSVTGADSFCDAGRGILSGDSKVLLAGTRGPADEYDTSNFQPFLQSFSRNFARAELLDVAMRDFSSSDRTFGAGEEVFIKVTFDAKVNVTGQPSLALNIQNGDASVQEADYVSGSGTKVLIFRYTVKEGDTTGGNRLATAGADSLKLNGGSITPSAGTGDEQAALNVPDNNRLSTYAYGDIVYIKAEKEEEQPSDSIDEITPTDSAAASAVIDSTLLKAVKASSVKTTAVKSKRTMTVTFAKVKNALNYRLSYRKAGASRWTNVWTKGKLKYVLKKMQVRGLYEFRIIPFAKAEGKWIRGKAGSTFRRYYQNVTGLRLKALKGKRIKVIWKKQPKVTGYEVLYSTASSMKNAKIKRIKGAAKKALTIKKLKKGKRYYIQIRPYKTYKGKKYIGLTNGKKSVKAGK